MKFRLDLKNKLWRERGIILLIAVAIGGWGLWSFLPQTDPMAGPIRLHVIANSDSSYDQALKLMVRDSIVERLTPVLSNVKDVKEATAIVHDLIPELEKTSAGIVAQAGYGAHAQYGVFDFPEKTYGSIVFPAGNYQALRLVLGEGKGHNWWCVLFPPLCFVEQAGELEDLEGLPVMSNMGDEGIHVRLKIAEIWHK